MSSPETPTAPVHELKYTAFLCYKHAAVAIRSGYSDSSKTFFKFKVKNKSRLCSCSTFRIFLLQKVATYKVYDNLRQQQYICRALYTEALRYNTF